jgi:hypothetical protein
MMKQLNISHQRKIIFTEISEMALIDLNDMKWGHDFQIRLTNGQ